MGSNGWVLLCQDCWQDTYPNRYVPDVPIEWGACAMCGFPALLYGSHQRRQPDYLGPTCEGMTPPDPSEGEPA